ncbi:ferric-dicitrate binding protein FerR (iron transport regulator) [Dysgonomonas hofstadii]|uniref:Ferric-dicitrate binding protein FerR (Iron transport regulator) n=1 Tax=Dysgonomonas hofstadii TaxID=637886 RepID=A0A840CHP0_9BACT|nr:FecR family protein [Dysgonomonas hofstadii]MBB4034806.1 ferric-dicitrate binding protein FerR (iron transport regulator) [Dysgonomonas hofstadii]
MKKEQEQYWRKVIHSINLFKRYFTNELDSGERERIENWQPEKNLNSSKGNFISDKVVEEHGMLVKKKVFNQLGIQNPEGKSPVRRKLFKTPYLVKYASAVAIVSVVIGVSYFMINTGSSVKGEFASVRNEKQLFVQTHDLQIKEVQLPDGSKIHLNSNSSIEYIQKEFGKDKREIWLEGEAYFDVAKNPDKPFIIHSKEITTTVHGTSFNIKSYDDIGEISVTVETGKVEVRSKQSIIGMLTPNKQLVYKEGNKTHVIADRNWEDAAAWMEKRLVLRDANVNELKIRLQQIYEMNIMIEDRVLSGSILNASYPKNTKISSVLQGISEIYEIKYSIDEKNKVVRIY